MRRIAIVSDIHYAGPGEQRHGRHYEFARAKPSIAKAVATLYRDFIWMRDPLANNPLLDDFCARAGEPELVIANGDYTCDVAGTGVSHPEGRESVLLCLGKLRARFGGRLHAIMGDHELGKVSLLGDHGGLRLDSWHRATGECGLKRFWRLDVGNYVLLGVTSTLLSLPMMHADALPEEWAEWERLRAEHLAEVRDAFNALKPEQRVLLFCHDPSALPHLWREEVIRTKVNQIAHTFVGHLHTRLLFWKTKLLAGMPPIKFLGISIRRMTTGLSQARHWRPFNVVLCPSLAGIQLARGGGFLTLELDESGGQPPRITLHPLRRRKAQ
ncbi:MAG: hypothetical protein RLY20_250 [Verrucomicrobiota bacterium]|jgi:hypothetical protein